MKIYLYRAPNLKYNIFSGLQFHGGSRFLATSKTVVSCDLFIIVKIIVINFFRWVFSECTEAIYATRDHLRNVLLSLVLAVLCGPK